LTKDQGENRHSCSGTKDKPQEIPSTVMVQLRELHPGIEEGNSQDQSGDFGKAQGYVENGVEG
jgi:hypothetical protein